MPRSSRHKSSKHSSKDAKERDYSDSEKETSLKERKSKEESGSSRVLKESAGSGEKRKLDSKENKDGVGAANGEYVEEYSTSSKRRKDRGEDGGNDRWNGGEDGKGEVSKKSKEKLSESKSKRREESSRRDDNVGNGGGETEEGGRRSSGKSEGKHKESSTRKDGADREKDREREKEKDRERERDRDRERKGKESRSEKLLEGEDHRSGKQVSEKTVLKAPDSSHDPEPENIPEKRIRRKRDCSGDGDKYQDDVWDNRDRGLSTRDDVTKDGRPKDERYRDKNHEGESRHRDDQQRDDRASRDHINSRSGDKHSRDEHDGTGSRHKKSKPQDIECDRDRDSDYDRDCEHDIGRDRDYDRGRDSDRHRERDRDREADRDHDWEWERDRDRDKDRERDRDRDKDRDYDSLYLDDRRDRNRESRSRKRSPDDLDDDTKLRSTKGSYTDGEKKFSSGSKIEGDADRGRSQSRQSHHENNLSGSRRRSSPMISSQGAADEYRYAKAEDVRYRDAGPEQRPRTNNSRDGSLFSGGSDRSSKLRSSDKTLKMDDGHIADLPLERTSSTKASPMGLVDRSPSLTSLERRYMSRNNVRRSLEIDESGRRNSGSMAARDLPSVEERSVRDLPMDKDDSNLNDSSFYNRSSQPNSVSNPPPPSIRGGVVSSPSFLGSYDDDGRLSTGGGRYKRAADLNMGRGQMNAWRGAPNWPSPLPNGFIPFQHGPHHGGFQPMLTPYPSPSLFGVRSSMELSHSGIPYHIQDADRFSGHLRPLGWQNMMDASGSSHLHAWDGGSNGIFRDEGHMFGGPEWNQNRHALNVHGWDSSSDIWKGQNGDITPELTSKSLKEENKVQAPVDDSSAVQAAGQKLQNETCNNDSSKAKTFESKPAVVLAVKESSKSHPKTTSQEKTTADPPKTSTEDHFANFANAYLSKVDISSELASSELYTQCMGLLKSEVNNASVGEDADVLINLKDGARAVPKNSSVFFSNTLFPASSDSIFKRAMEIYKKQRSSGMPCINGGIIDVIQASSEVKEQQQQSVIQKYGENAVEPTTSDLDTEMPDAPPVLDVEQKVPVGDVLMDSTDEAKVGEVIETSCAEEVFPVCAETPAGNLESAEEDAPPTSADVEVNNPLECIVGDGMMGNEEERPSDPPISEDSLPDDPPREGSPLLTSGQEEGDEGNNGSTDENVEEEKVEVKDAVCSAGGGSLVLVEDDDGCSSRASEGLMPGGTNESDESVILNRIHHSPESTH